MRYLLDTNIVSDLVRNPHGKVADIIFKVGESRVSIRAQLDRAGKPIGANVLLIAAQALTLGYTVVTDSEKEFSRVKHLNLENWLR